MIELSNSLELARGRSNSLEFEVSCWSTIELAQALSMSLLAAQLLSSKALLAAVFQSCCISSWRPSFVLQGCGLRLARVRLTLLELSRARQHYFEVCLMSGFQSGCSLLALWHAFWGASYTTSFLCACAFACLCVLCVPAFCVLFACSFVVFLCVPAYAFWCVCA